MNQTKPTTIPADLIALAAARGLQLKVAYGFFQISDAREVRQTCSNEHEVRRYLRSVTSVMRTT
jgi:hypothetical protein